MKKDLLTLLGCSSSIALSLMAFPAVHANPVPVKEYVFTSAGEGTEILAVEQSSENLIADDVADCGCQNPNFTDAEGDLAIATYGCDCAGCRFLVQNLMDRQSL